jgi:hypothetical protein
MAMVDTLIPEKTLREQVVGVSAVTWWNWRKTGRLDGLPAITIGAGGRRFYRPADVQSWMESLTTEKK